MSGDAQVEPLVVLNGRMIPASQASLRIYDAGVVMGATVTEMTRTFQLEPYRLRDHLARLYRSLKYTRLDIGWSSADLEELSRELIRQNGRLLAGQTTPGEPAELGMVHFVTAGELPVYAGSAGASPTGPTWCIHTFPLPFRLWARRMREGAHVVTPSTRHIPPQCYDSKMKCRSRMHYFLADQEARLVDPEAIALLLDLDGNVTETSGANFLIVEGDTIVSPMLNNILPGISRATVAELAPKLGLRFVERDIQVHTVMNADEAFLSSTPYCLLPVTRINGVTIGTGQPGPVLRRLLNAWGDDVGVDIAGQFGK